MQTTLKFLIGIAILSFGLSFAADNHEAGGSTIMTKEEIATTLEQGLTNLASGRTVRDIVMRHIRDTDVVGRLGGDEFDVILSHADDATTMEKAEALVSDIRTTPLSWQDQEIYIEVSYGASQFEPGDNPDRALAAADQAMYAQKRNNRQNSGEAE